MDTMGESTNQDEARSSRSETTAIIDGREGALVEEGTAMFADTLPYPILKSAVALNELIYIGCEKMECAPIGDDGDFSMVQDKSTFDSLLFDSRTFDSKTIDSRTLDSRTTTETCSMSDANGTASSKTWTENDAETLASWKSNAQSVTRNPSSTPTDMNLRYDRMKVLPPHYTSPAKSSDSVYAYTPGKIGVSIKYISRSQQTGNIDDQATLVESHVESLLFTTSTETEISEKPERPVEGSGSLRSMGRSLKKIITRPIKHKEIDPVVEILKEEERNFSNSPKAVDEQPKSTKTDGDSSSHRFRRMLHLSRKEPQSAAAAGNGDTGESGSSKRSSHFILESPAEKDRNGSVISPSSLRTRSILDKSKVSGVKNCSRRIMGRSVGFAPEDCVVDKNDDDKDWSRRSLKRSIMKKASLIGRLRGRGREGLPPTPQSKQPLKIDPEACEDDESEPGLDLNSTTSKAVVRSPIVRSPTQATTSLSDTNSREREEDKTKTTKTTKTKKSFVFLTPSDKGQEIALEDDKYFFHDPAQVHSLLTLPTFDDQQARQNGATKEMPIKLDIKL